jgi:hypothetical protein
MGIIASSIRMLGALATAGTAALTGAAQAQPAPTTIYGVYEQAAASICQGSTVCRIDFSTVSKDLRIVRVSCRIDLQTNAVTALIGDFQLGNASSDQASFSFGEYLAPLQLLSAVGMDQIYIANVETLHVVPAGSRPSVLIVTRIDPPVLTTAQCSISGTFS